LILVSNYVIINLLKVRFGIEKEVNRIKPVILVVEDDEGNFDALKVYLNRLTRSAYELNHISRVDLALEAAFNGHPALFVVDAMLDWDPRAGLELCRTLRADHRTEHIPIIVVTATADREVYAEAGEVSDICFHKPYSFRQLLSAIHAFIGQGEPELKPEPKPKPPDKSSSTPTPQEAD
jgi:DNA-binding response OmpR family regulator